MIKNPATVYDLNTSIYAKPKRNLNKKQGKLQKGSIKTGYAKTNVSSIPSKTENFLLPIDPTKHRFYRFSNSNPGVGKYSLSSNILQKSDSDSSKGFGTGFVSTKKRFTLNWNLDPGPGEYNSEKTQTIRYHIAHSLNGRSLYNSIQRKPVKGNDFPGPGAYDPINQHHESNYYFCLEEDRFDDNKYKTPYPGPGAYTPYIFQEANEKAKLKSTFIKPRLKERDLIALNEINRNQINGESKFLLRQNDKRRLNTDDNYTRYNTLGNCNKNKYTHKTLLPSSIQKEMQHIKKEADHNIRLNIEKEKELTLIKEILGNGNVPDKLFLSSPRWKYGGSLVPNYPGPAYYDIKNIPGRKHSYNRNISDFLVTTGPLHSLNKTNDI